MYLECVEAGTSKFWSGSVKGKVLTTRWGKIGTQGQSKEETFVNTASAKASLDKQAAAKVRKGYQAKVIGNARTQPAVQTTSKRTAKPSQSAGAPAASKPAKAIKSARKTAAPATKKPGANASKTASKKGSTHAFPTAPNKTKAASRKAVSAGSLMPTTKPQLSAWLKDASRTGSDLAAAAGKFPEADRLIAAHTLVLPETLSTLSHSSDKATRSKVAANPNTPPADYVRLGQQFPNEFLANPALDLLLLEHPGLLGELPEALLLRVLKREACPADFLVWAAGLSAEKLQLAVAMNPKAPEAALARLRKSAHAWVRESVSAASSELEGDPETLFKQAVREELAGLDEWDAREAWGNGIGLPQYCQLSLPARQKLAEVLKEMELLEASAANPRTPATALETLAEKSVYWNSDGQNIRRSVAQNPNTPVGVLCILAQARVLTKGSNVSGYVLPEVDRWVLDIDNAVRSSVAENPKTPVAVLRDLANLGFSSSVVRNPNTPPDLRRKLLEALSKDADEMVRMSVAQNPYTSTELRMKLLNSLAASEDEHVRRMVAENTNTPAELRVALLQKLARGGYLRLSDFVEIPELPVSVWETLAKKKDVGDRCSVATNPNTPVAVLKALANDKEGHVRDSVATNPNTSVAVLAALAKDKREWGRLAVAKNPQTPPALRTALLEALAKSTDSWILPSVARNPHTPVAVLEALAKDEGVRSSVAANPHTPVAVLEALAKDQKKFVRGSVAANPNTPVAMLQRLSKDKDSSVRCSVAANPTTPPDVRSAILRALANDKSEDVRSLVAKNPDVPGELLEKFADDESVEILGLVVKNPRTPPHVLHRVVDSLVARLEQVNSSPLSTPKMAKLLAKASSEKKRAVAENNFLFFSGKDPNKTVLSKSPLGTVLALCSDRAVAPARLARVVGSTEWLIRAAVARHCGTPPNMLKKLAADTHPLVRALASARRGA
jgi:predicted DNA-binding WGR domain protein/pentose-5-phosphate-3-epimerase